jgi:hypothetical protein
MRVLSARGVKTSPQLGPKSNRESECLGAFGLPDGIWEDGLFIIVSVWLILAKDSLI